MMKNNLLEDLVIELKNRKIRVHYIESKNDNINVAELKNSNIFVNITSRDELSVAFTIAHLYGHLIQFKDYEKYKHLIEIVKRPVPVNLSKRFLSEFWRYEKEAFCIGKGLLIDIGYMNFEIERKYSVFLQTDYNYFMKYLTTGENCNIEDFNKLLIENYNRINSKIYKLKPIFCNKNINDSIKMDLVNIKVS